MRVRSTALLATSVATLLLTSACGGGSSSDAGGGSGAKSSTSSSGGGGGSSKAQVGVILPDTKSSVRWESQDRPTLEKEFNAAGIKVDVQNAQNSAQTMATIADSMITEGVKVLAIVNLDSDSGAAIEAKAKQAGVQTIDYDRLTLGGSADYYVSYDNTAVGVEQGQGLATCLGNAPKNIVYLNGSPTDNNATLFAAGAHSVLDKQSQYKVVGEQAVPDWDNQQAATIFEQMLTQAGGKVDGVLAANDGLGNAAISILSKNGLAGKVPVTGQDASVQGLQNILAGTQCMSVYKSAQLEAGALVKIASSLIKGQTPTDANTTVKDATGKRDVKAVLLKPVAITKANVQDVVKGGGATVAEICTGQYAAACQANGVS